MIKDFKFYDNYLAFSFETPTGDDEPLKSDFAMKGDHDHLSNALIEYMERHPQLAWLICNVGYNYMMRNGQPAPPEEN